MGTVNEKTKVVIPRSRWLRGEGAMKSFLLRASDGKMCCLGHACLALGKTEDDIRQVKSPNSKHKLATHDLYGETTECVHPGKGTRLVVEMPEGITSVPDAVSRAMNLNDVYELPDAEREPLIAQALAEVGLDVEFVD